MSAPKPTFPSMTLHHQLSSGTAEAKKVTLVCSLTDFYPEKITVEWEEDKQHFRGSPTAGKMAKKDKKFSQTFQVDIDVEKWLSGSEYTCKVTQNIESKELSTSICSTHCISSPHLHLESVESHDAIKATCEVFTSYYTTVFWILDEGGKEVSKNYYDKKDSQSFVHSMSFPKDKWKSMKSITCEVQHKCFSPLRKTMNLTAPKPTFPSMTLYHQLSSDTAEAKKVTLVCSLTDFYPEEITVEWEEDKQHFRGSPTAGNMAKKDKKFSQTFQVDIDIEKWLSGSEYTCKVTQNIESKELSTSICSTHCISLPHLHLESVESHDAIKATCEVFTSYYTTVFWILDEGGQEVSKNYYDKKDSQSFVHSMSFPKDKWKSMKSITCEVQHKCFSPLRKTMNLTGETSVELYLQQGPQKPGRKVQRFLCLVSGVYPQVKWYLQSVEKSAADRRTAPAKDGRSLVASEIDVPQQEWTEGAFITCEVDDQALVKPISKTMSICTVTPPSSQTAELFLIVPPLEDTLKKRDLPFVCLLVGSDTSYFTITWKLNGTQPKKSAKREPPSKNGNGTETVRSTLHAKRSNWLPGSQITCEARHLCADKPLVKHLVKAKDLRPPKVQIMASSDSELAESGNASLLCVVSDYRPSQADIHWELNGKRLPASRYSSSPPLWISGSGGYAMHSWLLVPGSERAEGEYSCVVRHESSETPVNHTISNVFASLAPSPPQATLLQFSRGLICLVHGFSPAAINITWVLNDGVALLESNTSDISRGADGKFTIWSYLQVSWQPGAMFTCRVEHVTMNLSLSKSQPEISSDNEFFNENTHDPSATDSPEEMWNTAYAFLVIFLITLLYSIIVTLALMK